MRYLNLFIKTISLVFQLGRIKAEKIYTIRGKRKYCVFNLHIHFPYFPLLGFLF